MATPRVPTLDELMAMTPVRSRSESVENARAGVARTANDLERRGLTPARRQAADARAVSRRPSVGQANRPSSRAQRPAAAENDMSAREAGQQLRSGLATASGWPMIQDLGTLVQERVMPTVSEFGSGFLGMEETAETPESPSTQPTSGRRRESADSTNTGTTAAPATTAPARQTSFTNADAEAIGNRVNTIPALEVPEGPGEFETALLDAVQRLQPPRQQARLIRSQPDERQLGSAFEQRLRLRQQENQLRERTLDQEGELATEQMQQQRQRAAVTALAQMAQQERNLRSQLNASLVEAQANANTPEGRLAQARAAQIQEALVRLRAEIETGAMEPGEALPFLFDQSEQLVPVQGVTGTTGVFSNLRGLQPFAQNLLDPDSE